MYAVAARAFQVLQVGQDHVAVEVLDGEFTRPLVGSL
jgi:hypothetical protein